MGHQKIGMFERRPSCSDTGVRGRAIGAPNANIGGGTVD
jgi:hypothetical protein